MNLTELLDKASADLLELREERQGSHPFGDMVHSLVEVRNCLGVGAVNATVAMLGRCVESALLLHLEDNEIPIPRTQLSLHRLIELAKPTLSRADERLLWSLTDNLRIVRNQAAHASRAARLISRTELALAVCTTLMWLEREYRSQTDAIVPVQEAEQPTSPQTAQPPEPETSGEMVLFIRSLEATAGGLTPKESYDKARDAWRVSDARAQTVRIVGVVDRNGRLHSAYRVTKWLLKPGSSRKIFEGERSKDLEELLRARGLPNVLWGQNPVRYLNVELPTGIGNNGE